MAEQRSSQFSERTSIVERPWPDFEKLALLESGILDQPAIEFFVNGHCVLMAMALRQLTGWPIFFLETENRRPWHAVVEPSRGYYLDAEGMGAWRRFGELCGNERFMTLRQYPEAWYREPWARIDLVVPFALAVLKRHFPHRLDAKSWEQ